MASVAVIGGGISGLSTAYYLAKNSSSSLIKKVVLLEAGSNLGGWMRTTRHDDGCIFEVGPRSIRSAGKVGHNTLEMVEDLGLANEVMGVSSTHPSTKNRFIYANKKIHRLPNSIPAAMKRQTPFSQSMFRSVWKEPFMKRSNAEDESIHSFFTRRFNKEFADYLINPVCRGIYAGSSHKLSVRSCFGYLFDYEKKYGSITMGMLRAPKEKKPDNTSDLVRKFLEQKWVVWSLRMGVQQITDGLEDVLQKTYGVELLRDTPCTSLEFGNGKVQVRSGSQLFEVDHVVNSCYAKNASSMVGVQHPSLAATLGKIPAVTVGVVSLEFPGRGYTPEGFGHLVPMTEPSKVLGVIYESCVFEQHDNQEKDTTRVTCMMGGAWFNELFGDENKVTADDLVPVALEALREQLGITKEPLRVIAQLHKDCIPQYLVGHSQIVEDINTYIQEHSLPLSLVGSSYKGVSVNDCIYNAKLAAEDIIQKCRS